MTTQTNDQHICGACSHEVTPSPLWIALGQAIDRRQVAWMRIELEMTA